MRYQYHYYLWLMIIIGIAGSVYLGARQDKQTKVKNYIVESIDHVWISIGITFFVLSLIFCKNRLREYFYLLYTSVWYWLFCNRQFNKFSLLVWVGTGVWL